MTKISFRANIYFEPFITQTKSPELNYQDTLVSKEPIYSD
jgi:hypothetical protein